MEFIFQYLIEKVRSRKKVPYMEMKNTESQVTWDMIFSRSFHTATATGLLLVLIPLIAGR